MFAIRCKQHGPPESLVYEEVPDPTPGRGQVVVDVEAAGVNFPDTLIIAGKYQFQPPLPFSPGSEIAGVVSAVGDGVEGVSVGQRVIAGMTWGGYAQKALLQAEQLIPCPEGIDPAVAAGFILVYGTSYHALADRARLQPGETLVVLGAAGGVGLSTVELGKKMGARVIAAASTDEKLALCKAYGADEVINYTSEDLKKRIKALTGGQGADVVYDPVGGAHTDAALRATAWGGRYLVVGFASGDIPRIPLNLPLLKGCQVVGVFWGRFTVTEPDTNRHNNQTLLRWLAEGALRPHIHARYPLSDAAQALQDLAQRRVRGKVVLVP